jgi:hypothetical protein
VLPCVRDRGVDSGGGQRGHQWPDLDEVGARPDDDDEPQVDPFEAEKT